MIRCKLNANAHMKTAKYFLSKLSTFVGQGSLGAVVGVPVRFGQRSGAGGGVSLWEDEPAVLQPRDSEPQPDPTHRHVPLQIPTPNPKTDLHLCICHR